MSFESILASIGEEAERSQLKLLADKYPALREAGDALDPFKAAQIEAAELEKMTGVKFSPQSAAEFARKWQRWAAEHWDAEHNTTKGELATHALLDEANTRLAEIEASRGTEMTAEELNAILDKRFGEAGFAKTEDIKKMLPLDKLVDKDGKAIVATQDDLTRWANGMSSRFEEIYATLTPEMVRHHQTFGEPIDVNRVIGVMNEEFKTSGRPMKAIDGYKKAYAPEFEKRASEQREAEIKKAREEGIAEGKKAVAQATGGRAIPLDSKGGIAAMGAVARRVQAKIVKDAEGKTIDAPLGRGIIAQRAAAEYAEKNAGAA